MHDAMVFFNSVKCFRRCVTKTIKVFFAVAKAVLIQKVRREITVPAFKLLKITTEITKIVTIS